MNTIVKRNTNTKWISIAFVFIVFAFLYFVFGIYFGTIDDYYMMHIASGGFSGEPNGHLVFITYPLSAMIAFLYRLYNGINWYALTLLGCHFLAMTILVDKTWQRIRNHSYSFLQGIMGILILIAWLWQIVFLQFTTTAGVVGATAIFVYASTKDVQTLKNKDVILTLILLLLTYCIRSSVFWMTISFGGILYLFRNVNLKAKKITNLVFPALVLLGGLSIGYVDSQCYQGTWEEFSNYNVYRSQLRDYYGIPEYTNYQETYQELGISEVEYTILYQYHTGVVSSIGAQEVEVLADVAKQEYQDQQLPFIERVKSLLTQVIGSVQNKASLFLLVILMVCCISVGVEKNKSKNGFLIVCIIGLFVLECFFLAWRGRIIERAVITILMAAVFTLYGLFFVKPLQLPTVVKEKQKQIVLAIVASACLVIMSYWIHKSTDIIEEHTMVYADLEEQLSKENVYFFSFPLYSELHELSKVEMISIPDNNQINLGGWINKSPIIEDTMKKYHGKMMADVLVEKDNAYLLSSSKEDAEAVLLYLQEMYPQIQITVEEMELEAQNAPIIYKYFLDLT